MEFWFATGNTHRPEGAGLCGPSNEADFFLSLTTHFFSWSPAGDRWQTEVWYHSVLIILVKLLS